MLVGMVGQEIGKLVCIAKQTLTAQTLIKVLKLYGCKIKVDLKSVNIASFAWIDRSKCSKVLALCEGG